MEYINELNNKLFKVSTTLSSKKIYTYTCQRTVDDLVFIHQRMYEMSLFYIDNKVKIPEPELIPSPAKCDKKVLKWLVSRLDKLKNYFILFLEELLRSDRINDSEKAYVYDIYTKIVNNVGYKVKEQEKETKKKRQIDDLVSAIDNITMDNVSTDEDVLSSMKRMRVKYGIPKSLKTKCKKKSIKLSYIRKGKRVYRSRKTLEKMTK